MLDPARLDHPFSGALLMCFENDRPLQGWIADLDWRFHGHFSALMKQQILTGESGEILYAPLRWNDRTLHFVVVGGGFWKTPEDRKKKTQKAFENGLEKLDELKLSGLTVCGKDWGVSKDHPGAKERGVWIAN